MTCPNAARLLGLLASLLLASCASREAPPAAPSAPASESAVADPAAGPSLYELQVPLTTQEGKAAGLDVHRGSPVLLAMFYATCPSACPVLMEDIKRLESRLPPEVRARTRVLLVSLDPAKDEPPILKAAAERHSVDETRWTLARAPDENVRELAAVLGVKYRGRPDGEIDHSSAIYLLDEDGVIVEKSEGLGQPADAIVERLIHP